MNLERREGTTANYGLDLDLVLVWRQLWDGKWIVVSITSTIVAIAIIYALLATEWYRADVVLAPVNESPVEGLSGTLSSLAGLAGVGLQGDTRTAEALAILQSRDFIGSFIEEEHIMPMLFEERWDAARQAWQLDEAEPAPDIRDAVDYFRETVQTIAQDTDSGMVTLAIEWKDPVVAAIWANRLVDRLNSHMRQQALSDARQNIEFLQAELQSTQVVTLQQSVSSLLETELQKLMLARGNEEFAFRIIDKAQAPRERARPKRTLIVLLAGVLGGMVSVLVILVRESFRSSSPPRLS